MKLTNKLKQVWKEEIDTSGIGVLTKESGADRRTILKAIKENDCRQDVYDRVNAAILRLRGKRENDLVVKQLIGDQK